MRRHLRNPDIGSIVMSAGFTLASMALSAYCGWNTAAGSHMAIKIAYAIMFSLVAFGLSVYVVRRERYRLSRDREAYTGARRIVWFLLAANLLTDYSASASLRDMTNVQANNETTVANNARNEVTRIETRLADLKGEKAWRTKFSAPEAYDAQINAQMQVTENGRNIFQRSKECTDTTVASSQAVCQAIANLNGEKAMAQRRQVVLAEIAALDKELRGAKADVAENGIASNAGLAPIAKLVSMLTLTLENQQSDIQWGENFFVLFFTIVISSAIYFSSADLGRRLGPMPDPMMPEEPAPIEPENWWITDERPAPERQVYQKPIPLTAEPTPETKAAADQWRAQNTEVLDKIIARVKARQEREATA